MAWDFSTDPEFQEQLDWVEQFCREEIEPFSIVFPAAVRSKHPKMQSMVGALQQQIKDRGLWALFLDRELGGPGFGQLKLALINEILGRYPAAPAFFGTAAPDTGNMEMLAAYGTDEQKERWLYPLMRQEIWSAYSMPEPQGGSDPNLFETTAVRDGEEMVQQAVADSYAEINMLRLLVLWTAWTIDNSSTQEARTQIAACKYTCAKTLRDVSYRAIHVFGSLGVTDLTPLQAMWAGSPTMSVMDGVDEVHKVTVARNVLKGYRPHEGLWPTEYLPAKKAAAREKFAPLFKEDPELEEYADGIAAYMARRGA